MFNIEKKRQTQNKKYQTHIPCRFAYKVACIDNRVSKPVVLYGGKNAVNKFIEATLKKNE